MIVKILLFGKTPPPIGGVTIHIQRLMRKIQSTEDLNVDIIDYSRSRNISFIIKKTLKSDVIHIHLSNKIARLILVLLLRIARKKVLVTFHGKYDFENRYDRFVLKMSTFSIVLNKYTFNNAKKHKNNNLKIIGAFIPPIEEDIVELEKDIISKIEEYHKNYTNVFCVNASNYVLDERGEEIYMGTDLLSFFSTYQSNCLLFSDPKGNYKKFFTENSIKIPKNVFIIDGPHDFVNIIRLSDALIRATTMDGDSLSVKEALYYGVPVFATDVVDRPKGVILFKDFEELSLKIRNIDKDCGNCNVTDSSSEIIEVYRYLKIS